MHTVLRQPQSSDAGLICLERAGYLLEILLLVSAHSEAKEDLTSPMLPVQVKTYCRSESEAYHKEQGNPQMAIDLLPSLIFEPRPIVNGKKAPPNRAANGHTHRSKFC